MTELRGEVALVTGGGSGIGRRMALELGRRGARVAIWDIDLAAARRVCDEITVASRADTYADRCDVSDEHAVHAAAARIRERFGAPTILINNAGVVSGRDFLDLTPADIRRTFGVNTLALFWTTRAFLPEMMRRNNGHVVTIASASGLVGVPKLTDYAASKWAAVGFDESLRMELRDRAPGVRTTVVCPFFIDTGMFDGAQTRFPRLIPVLREQDVAERTIRAIERNTSRLILPPVVFLAPVGRLLPTAWFDRAAEFFGVNTTMQHFRGRPSAPASAAPTDADVADDEDTRDAGSRDQLH